ncbi:hypothetical protein Zmor_022763 [Zophobas morio]|uniref:Carboxylic ester hydrolase n=1 Tax=Zophobas morio TaxID=2755281 RepID=A0AA38HX18_9CUCU|nr:hypothetical protein Zmor_022763 [Zophobas morio]
MVPPELTIDQGTLRGSTSTDLRGNTYFKFQGIPYAKPPLGELRFKAPVPAEPWTGVFDATKEGQVCYHRDLFKNGVLSGGEDCLFLNVYTKTLPSNDNNVLRPVLFWVHGGAFYMGSGNEDLYGPDFLITEDVVVVTINYRLGVLGFLSLEDPSLDVPGNAGFKDQVLALKWVQSNISKFGGDPNNVTIFGESAGGAAIHLLVLSPMTKGLFHKAIAQSGCALNPWARGTTGCEFLGPALDIEPSDEKTIYNTLMTKSVDEIFEIQETFMNNLVLSGRGAVGFVVEKNSPDPFLDDEPMNIITSGRFNQVPFMVGYTTGEGMIFDLMARQLKDFRDVVPWLFGYQRDAPDTQTAADKIKKYYLGDGEISPETVSHMYNLFTDVQFLYGIYVTAISQCAVSKAPTYLYRVSVESDLNFMKKFLKIEVPGVSHLDDVGYLFKHFATPEIKRGSFETLSIGRFVKLWTNFAKFGNPTPDNKDRLLKTVWKPVTSTKVDFLDIGQDLVAMVNPDHERMKFWKQLYDESPAAQINK